ncbi:MAG: glycosyltransferase, partial [Acidobacteriota bacterium]
HPALVEAMGYGNCLVVNDAPENREAAGDAALYFEAERPETLARAIDRLVSDPEARRAGGERAAQRAAERYSWDAVSREYERLFRELGARPG